MNRSLRVVMYLRIAVWTFSTKAATYADHVSRLRIPARASASAENPLSRSTFSVKLKLFPRVFTASQKTSSAPHKATCRTNSSTCSGASAIPGNSGHNIP